LLRDALGVGSLRAFLDEVVKEAEDFKVEALQAIVFIIVQLLSNCIIIALQEVLAFLIRRFFIFHRVEIHLLLHLLL